jgi:hypothetical protein
MLLFCSSRPHSRSFVARAPQDDRNVGPQGWKPLTAGEREMQNKSAGPSSPFAFAPRSLVMTALEQGE